MGYALVIGSCYTCRRIVSFNPNRVPSVRDKQDVRQPVCRECIEKANPVRKAEGLPEITIHPDAYEPISEYEL